MQAASGESLGTRNLEWNLDGSLLWDTVSAVMKKMRDQIAEAMWKDYCKYILAHKKCEKLHTTMDLISELLDILKTLSVLRLT